MMQPIDTADRILEVLVGGNLSVLTAPERVQYVERVCASLGLNPLTKPFEFITLNGKLTLYATKACTDQLRQLRQVSVTITDQRQVGDLYVVTVTAQDSTGRQDSDMGVVATKNLFGENLANAMLKAVTKAKRRVTLSICGLGMLDETEVADIPASAKRAPVVMPQERIAAPAIDGATGEIIEGEVTGEGELLALIDGSGVSWGAVARYMHRSLPAALEAKVAVVSEWCKQRHMTYDQLIEGIVVAAASTPEPVPAR